MIDIKDMIQFADLWARLPLSIQDQFTNIFINFPDKSISSLLDGKLITTEVLSPIREFLEELENLYPASLVAENAAEVLSEIYELDGE